MRPSALCRIATLFCLGALSMPAFAEAPGAAPATTAAAVPLRALPALGGQLQFDGERAARTVSVFLSPGEARSGGELVLALQSGVSVMPEASTLSISVNGRPAAALPLGGSRPPATVALAANLLRPGWNTIGFQASQRHRVDCRLEATYDLWTRIDEEHSGLALPGGIGRPLAQAEDLPLLSRRPDGALPIRIRLGGLSDGEIAASFRLAAIAARAAGGGAVHADAGGDPLGGPGLEILAGSAARLAKLGVAASVIAAAEAAPQWIAPSPGRSAQLVARIETPNDAARAAAAFAAKAPPPLPAPAPVEGRAVRFSDLGLGTEEFSGRLFRGELELPLPPDSLTADYGRVSLMLEAAYAAGLDREANLSVFVNDRLAATLPFGRSAGEEFKRREIEMPLSAFRPGMNRVVVEARLPQAPDRACEPATQMGGSPRFLLLGESELAVPRLAHMARLPELASTVQAGPALGRRDPVMRLALAGNDADTTSAAAAFFVRNALAAGAVPPLEIGPVDPGEMRGVVVIGTVRDIGAGLLGASGLDAAAMIDVAAVQAGERLAGAQRLDPVPTGSVLMAGDGRSSESRSALQSWRMRAKDAGGTEAWGAATLGEMLASARATLGMSPPPEMPPLEGVMLAVAQSMPAGREGPLTVVTAFSPGNLVEGMDLLTRPEEWSRLAGQSLFLDADGKATALPAQSVRFVPTLPGWSPANMRLVTAAWFSLNPPAYALIVLVSALLFGTFTHALVRRLGTPA